MTPAETIVLPLGMALLAGGGIITSIVGVVVWVFANFERKTDADARHKATEYRLNAQENLLGSVARDVSYIRGKMEAQ